MLTKDNDAAAEKRYWHDDDDDNGDVGIDSDNNDEDDGRTVQVVELCWKFYNWLNEMPQKETIINSRNDWLVALHFMDITTSMLASRAIYCICRNN